MPLIQPSLSFDEQFPICFFGVVRLLLRTPVVNQSSDRDERVPSSYQMSGFFQSEVALRFGHIRLSADPGRLYTHNENCDLSRKRKVMIIEFLSWRESADMVQ